MQAGKTYFQPETSHLSLHQRFHTNTIKSALVDEDLHEDHLPKHLEPGHNSSNPKDAEEPPSKDKQPEGSGDKCAADQDGENKCTKDHTGSNNCTLQVVEESEDECPRYAQKTRLFKMWRQPES